MIQHSPHFAYHSMTLGVRHQQHENSSEWSVRRTPPAKEGSSAIAAASHERMRAPGQGDIEVLLDG